MSENYQLAQVNIARMLAPLTDPIMAGFVARLDDINALADGSPGFVWRLQTEEGDATALRPYEDDRIIVNLSVWASLDDHFIALWWVPASHIPSVEEAKERLEYLREHAETPYAFSFKKSFSAPEPVN